MSGYAELHCHSGFSLLDGASPPEALLDQAVALGMPALAITDHDGLYGAVRFAMAARERDIHPVIGAEITLEDAHHLVLLAETQDGYRNLCGLISQAQLANAKGQARTRWEWLGPRSQGLICLTGCRSGPVAERLLAGDREGAQRALTRLKEIYGPDHLYVELQHHLRPGDDALVAALSQLAADLGLPCVATNNVHYAQREGHCLQDVLVAIHHNVPLAEAGTWLYPNSEYGLKSASQMAGLFSGHEDALTRTAEIAHRCQVDLSFRDEALHPLPDTGGLPPDERLEQLCRQGLPQRYPDASPAALRQLDHELDVIGQVGLAGYFLLVWDIVRFAKERGLLARGRGSAANSIVAYLLGITNVDPIAHDLFFERFLSAEARVMPDIDLDLGGARREDVIQYVYQRYGEAHVAMVCNYVTYRQRSAVRDVGKALGLAPDTVDALAKKLVWPFRTTVAEALSEAGVSLEAVPDGLWERFLGLCEEIQGLPRHLSIHSGGMCITRSPLQEIVPLERATMPGRVVTQWDKDSIEDAGLIKIDILSLRTLSAIEDALDLIETEHGVRIDLDSLPLDDPAIYQRLCRADTIAAFQVESRAQHQALVKMQPLCFADIVVEVALIRPGPLQGNMVHPFFQRRRGLEPVRYPHPLLEPILRETLGVIVFQEQVIRIAVAMGGFSAGEADLLRRAMSRHRSDDAMSRFRQRFVDGALERQVPRDTAEAVFEQLRSFASFGFCKSHAAAFAKTAYDTLYLLERYPTAYYCAYLNNEPLGFYAPRVVISDARRHGVQVLPVHVNRSQDVCTLEKGALRLGLSYVDGLGEAALERLLEARPAGGYRDLADLCQRARLPRRSVENLILAGALDDWGRDQRRLLWELGRLRWREDALPLAWAPDGVTLEPMSEAERLMAEYSATGVSAQGHLMDLYRERAATAGAIPSEELPAIPAGGRVRVAGMVAVRQRPPTAKGFVFVTLEDEGRTMNVIIKPPVFEQQHQIWSRGLVLLVDGTVEREGAFCNVMAERAWRLA